MMKADENDQYGVDVYYDVSGEKRQNPDGVMADSSPYYGTWIEQY